MNRREIVKGTVAVAGVTAMSRFTFATENCGDRPYKVRAFSVGLRF